MNEYSSRACKERKMMWKGGKKEHDERRAGIVFRCVSAGVFLSSNEQA